MPRLKSEYGSIMARAEKIADSFEQGEPIYESGFSLEPKPDETPEDAYWRGLFEIAKRAAPEVVNLLFSNRFIAPTLRAQLLLQLWDKTHDKLFEAPDQTLNVKPVPLPEVTETADEWQDRISNSKSLPPAQTQDLKPNS